MKYFKHLSVMTTALATATLVQAQGFQRIAAFPTHLNIPSGMDASSETSAEIITASADGQMLIYSDSPLGGLGMIDISTPSAPRPAGFLTLEGEPTSVTTSGRYVLAAVNTSKSYTQPSGYLAVADLDSRQVVERCELSGQPDSMAVSPDGNFLAVAIENERDEDLNDGKIPQGNPGNVTLFPLSRNRPLCDYGRVVDMTGLADIAPSDPEPEFVDFNSNNEIVVSMQENNHIAIIDAELAKVIADFPAGMVNLSNVDLDEEGALTFDGTQNNRLREPDAVHWLDTERFVAANEGDYHGGARGFTIYNKRGTVLYESGLDFEYRAARAGHYPEKRSGNKGIEPEGLEVATFNGQTYIFVLSERGSLVGVYRDTGRDPEFVQLLPSGISPEGAIAIPSRNLLATANEVDLSGDGGVRAHVMLYEWSRQEPRYPQLVSEMKNGRPIGWGALSGLAADPQKPGILYAVNDSFYAMQPTIFTIDANQTPARIVDATPVTRGGQPAQMLDLEGIAVDGKGGFWLASEGRTDRLIPHAIYHVDSKGRIRTQIPFPKELMSVEKRWAAEGITVIGETLWIAIQRQWDNDPKDRVKLVSYNTKSKEWGAVFYPTEPAEKGWVGLSEITAYQGDVYLIERDNQIGANAKIKRLYRVSGKDLNTRPLKDNKFFLVRKELVHDFLPDLKSFKGFVVDKIEGFAVDAQGVGYAVTDNDGVDDSSGETFFFSIGRM